jgi:predicted NBD/HSP70 family sugar kinase
VLIPDVSEMDTGVGRAGARYGELLGRSAVLALAEAYGLPAETGLDVVRDAVSSGAGKGFLADLARRISAGLVGVVSLLDPELVLLAGDLAQAGGDVLRDMIATELHARVAPRTPVELASVTGSPVRAGATHAALAVAREEIFGLPADDMFGSST